MSPVLKEVGKHLGAWLLVAAGWVIIPAVPLLALALLIYACTPPQAGM